MINSNLKQGRLSPLQELKAYIHRTVGRKWRERVYGITGFFAHSDLFELNLSGADRCLVLAPHADDESIALGGLLLQWPDIFDVVCLTDCSTGNPEKSGDEAVKERRFEFEQAMASIGVNNYRFNVDIPSDGLWSRYDDFERLLKWTDLGQYSHVFLPHPFDRHPDHVAAAGHFHMFSRRQKLPESVKIVLYEVWTPIVMPNFYADISSVIKEKRELIGRYQSQVHRIDYGWRISGLNNYRGMIPHVAYAECFQLMTAADYARLPLECIRKQR